MPPYLIALLLTLLTFTPTRLAAAPTDSLLIGTRHHISSSTLGETREYWVSLPTRPASATDSLTVVYLLDGDSFFETVTGCLRLFSGSKVSSLSSCVVVALLNTDRTRDFTPTASAAMRDGTTPPGRQPEGGGAENFRRFLVEELRPAVERQLPPVKQRILMGHSYAALFTLHALLASPQAFDAYIAADPSLWWDRGQILKAMSSATSQTDFSGRQLYMAFGTQPRPDVSLIQFSLVDSAAALLPALEAARLNVTLKRFPEENHGTIAIPAFYDGLKTLFSARRKK